MCRRGATNGINIIRRAMDREFAVDMCMKSDVRGRNRLLFCSELATSHIFFGTCINMLRAARGGAHPQSVSLCSRFRSCPFVFLLVLRIPIDSNPCVHMCLILLVWYLVLVTETHDYNTQEIIMLSVSTATPLTHQLPSRWVARSTSGSHVARHLFDTVQVTAARMNLNARRARDGRHLVAGCPCCPKRDVQMVDQWRVPLLG